jgi:hypothetical protein
MDEQRMKENRVSLFHHKVLSGVVLIVVLDAVEQYVNASLEHTSKARSLDKEPL